MCQPAACKPPRRLNQRHPRVRSARDGLASHGVAPAVLSGAALGHDRVRDGTEWGQRARGHGHSRHSNRLRSKLLGGSMQVGSQARPRVKLIRSLVRAPHTRSTVLDSPSVTSPVTSLKDRTHSKDELHRARAAPASRNSGTPIEDHANSESAHPRPLGRLSYGRLPAFHLPPINPVVYRGPYLLKQWGSSSWGGIPA